jgi:hypothetical protein
VLGWPAGPWIVGAAGLAFIAVGLYDGYRGLAKRYRKRLDESELGPLARRAIHVVAVFGMSARMLVFCAIGWFVLRAAIDNDPNQAEGVDAALKRLADQPNGTPILFAVGLGLIAFGLYQLVEARYRDSFLDPETN